MSEAGKKYRRVWPEKRCKQIETLETLLREIDSINQATGIIERLDRIIKLGEELQMDRDCSDISFPQFLIYEAFETTIKEGEA